MCTVCGCSETGARVGGDPHAPHDHADHHHGHANGESPHHHHGHGHGHANHHDHAPHGHDHGHADGHGSRHEDHGDHALGHGDRAHAHGDDPHRPDAGTASTGLHFGTGPARAHAPGLTQARMIEIEENILAKNDGYAAANRTRFEAAATLALNLVSSPGSGKTTLLCETVRRLAGTVPVAVIEGDQQTENDAARIRAAGAPAVQVNTGKGCHLDAHMIGHALGHLAPPERGILFIENVGNLVCPAAFDLGEAAKVAILSVTEGEDKPLKYPDMFAAARVLLINKMDLAPHCDFDVTACRENARRVNPGIELIEVSARTGEGMDDWLGWLRTRRAAVIGAAVEAAEAHLAGLRAALARP